MKAPFVHVVSDEWRAVIAPLLPPERPKPQGGRPRLARRGVESSERLGKRRWVVERTLAWLNRLRRLTVRYERRADLHQAFLSLRCALSCWRFLTR